MQKPIRWGILGCGAVTEVKSGPPYQQIEGFELTAVMRRNKAKAADYAKRHDVPTYYTSAQELIADPQVDAVYIATPPDSHKVLALQVAAAGKPCCIEKPMAPSFEDSLAIYQVFNQAKLPLFVAYYRRSLPRFERIRNWLDSGAIGVPRHISWNFAKPPNEMDLSGTYNWRTDAKVAPGGYFDDLASHGLDLFAHYFGPISQAVGISTNQQHLYTAKDAISGSWIHTNGVTGSGSWNFGHDQRLDEVHIQGSAGSIRFSVFEEAPVVVESASGKKEETIPHPPHVQHHHVAALRDHLLKGVPHPSQGLSALQTSWAMDRILGNTEALFQNWAAL